MVKGGQGGPGPEEALSLRCLALFPNRLSFQEPGGDSVSVGESITMCACVCTCV